MNKTSSPFMSPTGYPTGLIYGMLSMLSDWIQDIATPSKILLFLDGVPRRRLILDPQYKQKTTDSERPGSVPCPITLSDGFVAQNELDILVHLFKLFGIDIYHNPDEEADDLIASYIDQNRDDINVIMSSDRDYYQLLSDNDRIIIYRPGVSGNRFYDAERATEDLMNKYGAHIPPSNIRMFKALTGDPSDGISGIFRLRKKAAAPLCSSRTIDELYETGFPGFSKSEKSRALLCRDRIHLNYKLIGFNRDLNLSDSKREAISDHRMASQILHNDLGIRSINISVFACNKVSHLRTSNSYDLLPDFLKHI
jgi:5'-3' exonuclease